jgi:hypothetical protein
MIEPTCRFTPPWDIEDNGACFIIRDENVFRERVGATHGGQSADAGRGAAPPYVGPLQVVAATLGLAIAFSPTAFAADDMKKDTMTKDNISKDKMDKGCRRTACRRTA